MSIIDHSQPIPELKRHSTPIELDARLLRYPMDVKAILLGKPKMSDEEWQSGENGEITI